MIGSRLLTAVLGIIAALLSMMGRSEADVASNAVSRCDSLASVDFSQILDAPTRITEVKSLEPSGDEPDSCQVTGYVAPTVGFLLILPTKWNGKLLQFGCGGFCGEATASSCTHSVRRGYACVTSDNGHRSTFKIGRAHV